jgi:ADP-glucose pyrophosphorylase
MTDQVHPDMPIILQSGDDISLMTTNTIKVYYLGDHIYRSNLVYVIQQHNQHKRPLGIYVLYVGRWSDAHYL